MIPVKTMAARLARTYPRARFTPYFVYGTLRPGEANYWVRPAVAGSVEPVTARGQMFARGIPWVDFDLPGDVVGALLFLRPGELAGDMCAMELGAGYESREVEVTLPDGSRLPATAWHHPVTPGLAPHLVPSGDFRDTPGSRFRDRAAGARA